MTQRQSGKPEERKGRGLEEGGRRRIEQRRARLRGRRKTSSDGTLARSKTKGRVDDKSEDDRAEDADRRALGVNRDGRQQSRREGDDGDNDACLRHRLSFDFED
jgi:hypothetical protein